MKEHLKLIKSKANIVWDTYKRKPLSIYILIAVVLFSVICAIYFSFQDKNRQEQLKNPSTAAQTEQISLIDTVGKLTNLPQNEKPTIATVSDVTMLKNKKFFAHAKNGFKVITYQKANRAILYDPFSNKIINDGQIESTF